MQFETELEAFRREQQSAQQFFFGYLSLQQIPGANEDVLGALNENPQFWITARFALLMATFVTLGRIFDQNHGSRHNVDKLMQAVSNNLGILSRSGLSDRRISSGMDPVFVSKYVADKYDLTIGDVREMRKVVGQWRGVYNARYRDIRHFVFAHRVVSDNESEVLFARTRIDEMLEMLGFLESLNTSLWELHANGRRPNLQPKIFVLPPANRHFSSETPGERIYRQAMDLMYGQLLQQSLGPAPGGE